MTFGSRANLSRPFPIKGKEVIRVNTSAFRLSVGERKRLAYFVMSPSLTLLRFAAVL